MTDLERITRAANEVVAQVLTAPDDTDPTPPHGLDRPGCGTADCPMCQPGCNCGLDNPHRWPRDCFTWFGPLPRPDLPFPVKGYVYWVAGRAYWHELPVDPTGFRRG